MARMIKKPIEKEEEPEEIQEEETKPIFKEELTENIEQVIEEVEEEVKEEKEEPKPKTRKKKTMTEEAKKQLAAARLKSIESRKSLAMKKKQEKEQNENKKYIDEIDNLKKQIQELQNKPQQEKIVEKVIYKEPEESNYKFNLEDLEYYAESYMKKHKEIEDEVRQKRNRDIRNKYFLHLR